MIKEGIIKYNPVTIEYCEREENKIGGFAITPNQKIVAITAFDKTNNVVKVSEDGIESISVALGASVWMHGPLYYPVIEHKVFRKGNPGEMILGERKDSLIKLKLWQYIIDNNLHNVKIEFDDSEEVVAKIILFKKPVFSQLTKVFKIKMILFQSYGMQEQQGSQYLKEDYSTLEEAEAALPEIAKNPHMDIDQNRQCYFKIEEVLKRKEYEKVTYKS